MSKNANPGELRTKAYFKRVRRDTDDEGFPLEPEENVFGEGNFAKCKWVNAHGSESFVAKQLELREPATITMRYSPLIKDDLLVYRGSDTKPYEIISIDNVEEQNRWLEIKVQRVVSAR